jgi:glycosyltransferase involved in cell wall biosynthesis
MLPPLVSVVVPAYDVAPYLPRCLGSLLRQSVGFDRLEVVAVDDGSSDGTGELLDRFAAGRPNVTVVHQANSGGPGGPRNLGVALSRGEHLFFLDPDDHLGPEALERMVAAAHRNEADVVLGTIVGVGRNAPRRPFAKDVERGDLLTTRAVWSLSCQKLFRRSHVLEQGLRFLEGVRLGEDQEFVVGAYLTARVISVVAGYPCYYLELRDGAGNATREVADPVELYGIVARVLAMLDEHAPAGPVREEVLGRYYAVEISSRVGGAGFLGLPPEMRETYVRQVRPLVERWFDDALLAGFPALDRVRHHLLRQGAVAELEELAAFEVHGTRQDPVQESGRAYARYPFLRSETAVPDHCYDITTELALDHCRVRVGWEAPGLAVGWEPSAPALRAPEVRWSLALEPRGGGSARTWPAADGSRRLQVGSDALASLPDGSWALVSRARTGGRRAHLPVGAAGTVPDLPAPAPRLLGARLATLRRDGRGRVHLDLTRTSERLPVSLAGAHWADGAGARLLLDGLVAVDGLAAALSSDADGWTAGLRLQHRSSGRAWEGTARLEVTAGGEAGFRGQLDLSEDADPDPPEPGRCDVHLQIRSGNVVLTGRVGAPAEAPPPRQAGERLLVPYATVRGNLSLEVRPTPQAVLVSRSRWSGRGVLHLRLAPTGGGAGGALVLRHRRPPREVALPLPAAVPGAAAEVGLDLARALAAGRLTPGTWELWVRPEQGAERRLQPGPGWSPTGSRRWLSRARLASSRVRRRPDGLVVVIAQVSAAGFLRRRAAALGARLHGRG